MMKFVNNQSFISKNLAEFYSLLPVQKDDECSHLKSYLEELLALNTVAEIIGYYNVTKNYNFIFIEFESSLDRAKGIDEIKEYLILSGIKNLKIIKDKNNLNI